MKIRVLRLLELVVEIPPVHSLERRSNLVGLKSILDANEFVGMPWCCYIEVWC